MKDIRGSHAIVTGASRGIGTYIAKTLAAQGVTAHSCRSRCLEAPKIQGARVRPWGCARSLSQQT